MHSTLKAAEHSPPARTLADSLCGIQLPPIRDVVRAAYQELLVPRPPAHPECRPFIDEYGARWAEHRPDGMERVGAAAGVVISSVCAGLNAVRSQVWEAFLLSFLDPVIIEHALDRYKTDPRKRREDTGRFFLGSVLMGQEQWLKERRRVAAKHMGANVVDRSTGLVYRDLWPSFEFVIGLVTLKHQHATGTIAAESIRQHWATVGTQIGLPMAPAGQIDLEQFVAAHMEQCLRARGDAADCEKRHAIVRGFLPAVTDVTGDTPASFAKRFSDPRVRESLGL